MIDEIRSLIARHLPHYEITAITALGEGLDNVVFDVNGELIVRASKEANPALRGEATRREAQLLDVVARLCTLPVPEPVFTDPDAGVLAYTKLRGVPLIEGPVPDPRRLAGPLGEFVTGMHRASVEEMAALVPYDTDPPVTWHEDAVRAYDEIATHLPADVRPVIERFLAAPPPSESRAKVFCHNDLGSEHMLVDVEASTLTGIIDWTDAAISDPAHDLAKIYRDLGPEITELILAGYDRDWNEDDGERMLFYARCSLLEDLAYGASTGPPRYAESALAHLAWTFAPPDASVAGAGL